MKIDTINLIDFVLQPRDRYFVIALLYISWEKDKGWMNEWCLFSFEVVNYGPILKLFGKTIFDVHRARLRKTLTNLYKKKAPTNS